MQAFGEFLNFGMIGVGHLFMIGVVLFLGVWLVVTPFKASNNQVRLMRILALIAGIFIAYISKFANLSYSTSIIDALGSVSLRFAGIDFLNFLFPGIAGLVAGFIFTRLYRKGGEKAILVCLLFGAIAFLLFLFSYGYIIEEQAFFDMSVIMPNFSFIVGVILVVIFFSDRKRLKGKKEPQQEEEKSDNNTILL